MYKYKVVRTRGRSPLELRRLLHKQLLQTSPQTLLHASCSGPSSDSVHENMHQFADRLDLIDTSLKEGDFVGHAASAQLVYAHGQLRYSWEGDRAEEVIMRMDDETILCGRGRVKSTFFDEVRVDYRVVPGFV